ncbi:MAG: YihY/virulence factor BrkB family protein [Pseudomonadota bacterium]
MSNDPPPYLSRLSELAPRFRAAAEVLVRAARRGAAEFSKDKPGQIAAALTYHTLFSLLPVMALALVILRTFVGPEEQQVFKELILDAAIDWLVVDEGAAPAEPAAAAASGATEYDAAIARIDETVGGLLDRLYDIDFQSIGAIGVLVFIYAATGLLATIEQSFNQIYGVNAGRRWHYRLPLYYTTITLAPLVIIAGQVLQERAMQELAGYAWTDWLAGPMSFVYPLLTTWIVFYLMYLLIPNARVKLRAAAIGAALAAFASVALLELFSIYTSVYAGRTLYGSLALLPLAMLWMWLNWLIVLFGLEVSYVLQTGPTPQDPSAGKRLLDAPSMSDPRWLIVVLSAVAERFKAGETASLETIAMRLRTTEAVVGALADHLVQKGFLHRLAEGERAGSGPAYALARPPEDIKINEVFALWPGDYFDADDMIELPGGDVIARLETARSTALATLHIGPPADADEDKDG